jgi:hypothetical protein
MHIHGLPSFWARAQTKDAGAEAVRTRPLRAAARKAVATRRKWLGSGQSKEPGNG